MIPHNRPCLGEAEAEAAARVLRSGWVAQGPEVAAFEDEVCAFVGLPAGSAVAVSSGSAALWLALQVLGLPSPRVALPSYACTALSNAIHWAGGTPVYLDCQADNPNAEPPLPGQSDIWIAPWTYGIPVASPPPEGCVLIEDAAQALGATLDGLGPGHRGEIAVLSFYATKMITSGGQGGMLLSRCPALIAAARDFRAFDGKGDGQPRFNLQMTDVQAAVGREQLRRLPAFIARRQQIFTRYQQIPLDWLASDSDCAQPVRYRAVFRSADAAHIIDQLAARGVRAICPLEPAELLVRGAQWPHAEAWAAQAVSVPLYPALSDNEVDQVVRALEAVA